MGGTAASNTTTIAYTVGTTSVFVLTYAKVISTGTVEFAFLDANGVYTAIAEVSNNTAIISQYTNSTSTVGTAPLTFIPGGMMFMPTDELVIKIASAQPAAAWSLEGYSESL